MFYTDRLMIRGLDSEADAKVLLHWLNNVPMLRAIRADAPMPGSRDKVKTFLEELNKDNMPTFAICGKPPPNEHPNFIGPSEDIFWKDSRPRYPCIGILNIRGARGNYSATNRVAALGIAFSEEHQSEIEILFFRQGNVTYSNEQTKDLGQRS